MGAIQVEILNIEIKPVISLTSIKTRDKLRKIKARFKLVLSSLPSGIFLFGNSLLPTGGAVSLLPLGPQIQGKNFSSLANQNPSLLFRHSNLFNQ